MLLLREVGDVLNTDEGRLLNTLWGISVGASEPAGLEWTGGRLREGDLSRFDRFSGVSLLGVPVLSTLSEPVLFFRVFILKSVGSSEHSELLIAATSSF